jgi:hypothetical protein
VGLSRAVRDDDAVTKEFDDGLDGLIDRLRTRQPDFALRFAGFLAEYGYLGGRFARVIFVVVSSC